MKISDALSQSIRPIPQPPTRYMYHGSTKGDFWKRIQKVLDQGLIGDSVRESKYFKRVTTTEEINQIARKKFDLCERRRIVPEGLLIFSTPDAERAARYASARFPEMGCVDPDPSPNDPDFYMPFSTNENLEHIAPIFQIDTTKTDSGYWFRDLMGPKTERKIAQYCYLGMIPPEALTLCFYNFATGSLDKNPSRSKIEQYFKGFDKFMKTYKGNRNFDFGELREHTTYHRSYIRG